MAQETVTKNFDVQAHHAHLWIGDTNELASQVTHELQKQFCTDGGCTYCSACQQIYKRQHHALLWITPEKSYTREHIQPLLHELTLQRPTDEPFFCVLEHADFLNATTANALLKSLEEPPAGYYFILLASRKQMVLPTIRSRCVVRTLHADTPYANDSALFRHFSGAQVLAPIDFLTQLDKEQPSERDSVALIDALLVYWRAHMRKAIEAEHAHDYSAAYHMLRILMAAAHKPPMPGSSKLFWRDLFLRCHR